MNVKDSRQPILVINLPNNMAAINLFFSSSVHNFNISSENQQLSFKYIYMTCTCQSSLSTSRSSLVPVAGVSFLFPCLFSLFCRPGAQNAKLLLRESDTNLNPNYRFRFIPHSPIPRRYNRYSRFLFQHAPCFFYLTHV